MKESVPGFDQMQPIKQRVGFILESGEEKSRRGCGQDVLSFRERISD